MDESGTPFEWVTWRQERDPDPVGSHREAARTSQIDPLLADNGDVFEGLLGVPEEPGAQSLVGARPLPSGHLSVTVNGVGGSVIESCSDWVGPRHRWPDRTRRSHDRCG